MGLGKKRFGIQAAATLLQNANWKGFFTGDAALLCTLDRIFDKASVFMMSGPSYRGRELDTYSVEAVPEAIKTRGIQPIAP